MPWTHKLVDDSGAVVSRHTNEEHALAWQARLHHAGQHVTCQAIDISPETAENQVAAWLARLGLRHVDGARVLNIKVKTLRNWANGLRRPSALALEKMNQIEYDLQRGAMTVSASPEPTWTPADICEPE